MEAWFGIFARSGGRVLRMSAAQTEAFVKAEIKKWSALICVTGTSAE